MRVLVEKEILVVKYLRNIFSLLRLSGKSYLKHTVPVPYPFEFSRFFLSVDFRG